MAESDRPIRRVRLRRRRTDPTRGVAKVSKTELDAMVDSLGKDIRQKEELEKRIAEGMLALENVFKANNLQEWEASDAKAVIVRPMGRSSSFIPPEEFAERVSEQEFFEIAVIPVTAARKVLPERILNSILRTTPGKPKPPELKIILLDAKGKKK